MDIDKLLVGLALAFVSGITFLAYKHPTGFAKLFPWLMGTTTTLYAAFFGASVGAGRAYDALKTFIPTDKAGEASRAADVSIPDVDLVYVIIPVNGFI